MLGFSSWFGIYGCYYIADREPILLSFEQLAVLEYAMMKMHNAALLTSLTLLGNKHVRMPRKLTCSHVCKTFSFTTAIYSRSKGC